MAAFIEPLPGLLDDPLLHLPDLPSLTDVRIPPLRDPFPSRTFSAPSPLEPNAPGDKQIQGRVKFGSSSKAASKVQRTTPKITHPIDLIFARDTTKSNLAISDLVDPSSPNQLPRLLPPSFVNLAAVENHPTPQSWLPEYPSSKRTKLDQEYHGDYVQLPKPRQKETAKRVPLLPTIVNGIHEPPPSAALLPPMELEEVKAMLASISEPIPLPPEKMLNSIEVDVQDIQEQDKAKLSGRAEEVSTEMAVSKPSTVKAPRTWKKWSDDETQQLLKGVAKHGAGKWKEICSDPGLKFRNRKPMDLKDRYRICAPNANKNGEAIHGAPFDPLSTPSKATTLHDSSSPTTSPFGNPAPTTTTTTNTHPPQPLHPLPTSTSTSSPSHPPDPTTTSQPRPLPPHQQRIRKLWTQSEHDSLVRGFGKHGYQWTAIRNDASLNLSHRKATDIRDKFRSLFPQQYMDAESGPPSGGGRKGSVNGGLSGGGGGGGNGGGNGSGVCIGIGDERRDSLPQLVGVIRSVAASTTGGASGELEHEQQLQQQQQQKKKKKKKAAAAADLLLPPPPAAAILLGAKPVAAARLDEAGGRGEGIAGIAGIAGAVGLVDVVLVPDGSAAAAAAVPSLTLPPLTLGDNDWDWEDNKLAPLLDWEEFGL